MKKIILAAVALVAISTAANAGNLPSPDVKNPCGSNCGNGYGNGNNFHESGKNHCGGNCNNGHRNPLSGRDTGNKCGSNCGRGHGYGVVGGNGSGNEGNASQN